MQLAVTIARKGSTIRVITGPEVPLQEQSRQFRSLRSTPAEVSEHDEIQMWTSGQGRIKRHKFHVRTARAVPTEPQVAEPTNTEAPAEEAPAAEEAAPVLKTVKKAKKAGKPAKQKSDADLLS